MTHPLFAKDVKKGTKEHKKAVYTATLIVFALCAVGGLLLGYRINKNEQYKAKQRLEYEKNPEKFKNKRRPPVPR